MEDGAELCLAGLLKVLSICTTQHMCGVVWCGVVWCGVVWCGVVWCGVVWCGVVWCGVVWCGVVWCGVVWCGVVWCGVVWCGVVWCGVVWCGAMIMQMHIFPIGEECIRAATSAEDREGYWDKTAGHERKSLMTTSTTTVTTTVTNKTATKKTMLTVISSYQRMCKTPSCTLSDMIHWPVSQLSKSKLKSGRPQSLSSLAPLSSELLSYSCLSVVQLGCLRLQLLQQLHGAAHVTPEILQQPSLQINTKTVCNVNIHLRTCVSLHICVNIYNMDIYVRTHTQTHVHTT